VTPEHSLSHCGRHVDLKEACAVWQTGRDGGSSRLRGAARVLTRVPHYFEAPYITEHERQARSDEATLERARLLMSAVASSRARTASEWCASFGLPDPGFAGRGLASKAVDEVIRDALETGEITMPLWGVSLDIEKAREYGDKFLFELHGLFRGVAAWVESGGKEDEREIITGGRYEVGPLREHGVTIHVPLRELGQVWPTKTGASGDSPSGGDR